MRDDNGSELHPAQAAFRFSLEMAALVGWGIIGWQVSGSIGRWVAVLILPLVAIAVWGTFRTPGDHSADGGAPIAVPGSVRLAIELAVLLGAAILTAVVWRPVPGLVLALLVILHYVATPARVRWLLAQHPAG